MKNTAVVPGQLTFFDVFAPLSNNVSLENGLIKSIVVHHNTSTKTGKEAPLHKFIKEYNGYVIEDIGAVASKDFKSYCRKLGKALDKTAKQIGFDYCSLKSNHYYMSGFFRKSDKYVYWSFDVSRGNFPTFLDKKDAVQGFLYRTAQSNKDFRGGDNHFTDLANLVTEAYALITKS